MKAKKGLFKVKRTLLELKGPFCCKKFFIGAKKDKAGLKGPFCLKGSGWRWGRKGMLAPFRAFRGHGPVGPPASASAFRPKLEVVPLPLKNPVCAPASD